MNLTEILRNQLTSGDTMSVISNLLGEEKAAVQSGIDAILPTLMGSVIQKGSNTEGVNMLMNLIKDENHDGSILNNISGILGNHDKTNNVINLGASLVHTFLGDKSSNFVSTISSLSGLKNGSTSSLLKLTAPLLIGLIGKQTAGQGASGLMSLLLSQSDFVKQALPPAIINLLGLGNLGSNVSTSNELSGTDSEGDFGKLLPWLMGAVLFVGSLYAWKSCDKTEVSTPTITENVTKTDKYSATTANDAVVDAASKVVEAIKVSLPGGVVLDIPKGSLEDKIVKYIQSNEAISKTLWFDFDRLLFETGKSTLKPESEEQLKNVEAILKAFTKVKIKLGGYTDNTGNAAGNVKLSAERAKNVMMELVKLGVAANRLSAEGYGDKNPVATNDTEEGRAQNRRISISVREK